MSIAKVTNTNSLIRNYIFESLISRLPVVNTGLGDFPASSGVYPIFTNMEPPLDYSTACWGSNFNLDGISFHIDGDVNNRGGVLISPTHIYYAKHSAHVETATPIFYEQSTSLASSGTIDGLHTSAGETSPGDDFALAHLDAAIPNTSVHTPIFIYYKVLPADYDALFSLDEVPCILINQDSQLVPKLLTVSGKSFDTSTFANTAISYNAEEFLAYSPRAQRVFAIQNAQIRDGGISYAYQLKTGDSSYPVFIPFGDELVLIGVLTSDDGDGAFITGNLTEVNSLMAGSDATYTAATEYDLGALINRLTNF